jgi:deoxyribodipyrimidine photo-lyase
MKSERNKKLNRLEHAEGDYVLCWMQAIQRAEDNHALEYAMAKANALHLPALVVFGLTARYPEANLRHYAFMLEGLRDVRKKLADRKILFAVQPGEPPGGCPYLRPGKRAEHDFRRPETKSQS